MRAISFGGYHTCVHLYDASVACTGGGDFGQLGDGITVMHKTNTIVAASVLAGIPVSSIQLGNYATCVLAAASEGNKVYCLGSSPVLEAGGAQDGWSHKPVAILGLKPTPSINQLVGSSDTMCVSYAGTGELDTVQCWGTCYGAIPFDIAGTSGTVALAEYDNKVCALLIDKSVSCWSCGDVVAVPVAGISNAARIVAGRNFNCVIIRSAALPGSLWCWGMSLDGVSDSDAPWRVEALAGNVLDVAAGQGHVCALVEVAAGSGDVYCWGSNYNGQLGQGYVNVTHPDGRLKPPMRVKGISKVTAVFAGGASSCALTLSQRVLCWGSNFDGRLGVGADVLEVTMPVSMKGLCA